MNDESDVLWNSLGFQLCLFQRMTIYYEVCLQFARFVEALPVGMAQIMRTCIFS